VVGRCIHSNAFPLTGQPTPKLGANQAAASGGGDAPAHAAAPVAAAPAPTGDALAAAAAGGEVSAIGTKFGLSLEDVVVYEALWTEAAGGNDNLPAGGALKFFTTSGLPMADLKIVWSASDTAAPKGQLNKEEFFGACKLIAVKQSGGALHPNAFPLTGQPTPKFA
jgi:hypothetical protein